MTKAQLALRFGVHGRFYEIDGNATPFQCRDVLEITRAGRIDTSSCDAIFVMMNPGGSKPRTPAPPGPLAHASIVTTEPDETQYQLMRLMEAFQWSYVRVLNLSDLRESDSNKLPMLLKKFQDGKDLDSHSVFSAMRRDALAQLLARKPGALVFTAWGVSPRLRKLAELALRAMREQGIAEVHGVKHPTRGDWAYYHPLPQNFQRRRSWCQNAFSVIDAHNTRISKSR
jgi:hypothetical protein